MRKLDTLRQHLLQSGLNIQPEDIVARVKSGDVLSHYAHPDQTSNANLRLKYSAELLIMDYTGAAESLCYLVSAWLSEHQPGHAPDVISFEAEILDNNSVDLLITIRDLTDIYHVSADTDGTHINNCRLTHIDRKVFP